VSEIVKRWRILWVGEAVCLVIAAGSIALFYYSPSAGDYVLRHAGVLLVWIGLLLSPLLWLEFAIFWALGVTTGERTLRIGGALVFPALVGATATGVLLNPNSVDQLLQPVAWIWIFTVGLRLAHAMAVVHAAKSD
jgi:hypothetical protein